MKNALFIVPDLELNGAQTVLSEILELFARKYRINIISPQTGEYRDYYSGKGYNIEFREYVVGDSTFRRHIQNDYDLVFLNSSSVAPYIFYFLKYQRL